MIVCVYDICMYIVSLTFIIDNRVGLNLPNVTENSYMVDL